MGNRKILRDKQKQKTQYIILFNATKVLLMGKHILINAYIKKTRMVSNQQPNFST